jgi:hypothetical protein
VVVSAEDHSSSDDQSKLAHIINTIISKAFKTSMSATNY